jgi:hypothetical protein
MLRDLDPARRARARAVDLDGTGLAHVRDAVLPADPRTGEPFVLSGEPAPAAAQRVSEPETNLQAMLLDAIAREVLPVLYARAGRDDVASSLRDAPAASDLYEAYRLRERLLEACPPGERARGPAGAATRACRHATRLVRPVPTARARPSWAEQEPVVAQAIRGVAREAASDDEAAEALVVGWTRLATVAVAVAE